MTISKKTTYEIIEYIYVILSIVFLILGFLPIEMMVGFFGEYYYNLPLLYFLMTIPFWPICLYVIFYLFRKYKRKNKVLNKKAHDKSN